MKILNLLKQVQVKSVQLSLKHPKSKTITFKGIRIAGYSLIELVVVAGMLAVLALMSWPALQESRNRAELHAASEALTALVRAARLQAIATDSAVWVGLSHEQSLCLWRQEQRPPNCPASDSLSTELSPQIDVEALFGAFVATRFYGGSGMAGFASGRFELRHHELPHEAVRVIVSSLGRVRTCSVGVRQVRLPPC